VYGTSLKLGHVSSIVLSNNNLRGFGLSESIATLANLSEINLENNHITGPIPKALQSLYFLQWINLSR
jgi:hypothetical protein